MLTIKETTAKEKSNNLLFIYNQYNRLIQAGYLIVAQKLTYKPNPNKYNGKSFGQWLLDVKHYQAEIGELALSDEEPHILSLRERAAPMDYCIEALSYDNVLKLRFGLKEWLDTSLSDNSDTYGLDNHFAFRQFITLQKLTEAFYLIITTKCNISI